MKVAIIAGSGDFPIYIAKENKSAFILCLDGLSLPTSFQNKSEIVSLFDPDSWIACLKNKNINHVVIAGKVNRPNTLNKSISKKNKEMFSKISSVGDNQALHFVEKFFNNNGIIILPVYSILKNCFLPRGFYLEHLFTTPFKNYVKKCADFGVELLNTLSKFDVGQSVVVSNELVYSIEGLEGTNSMINRVGKIYHKNKNLINYGPVLIKIPKMGQKMNLDLPVIGINTLENCKKNGINSIVVSSNGTLVSDIDKVQKYINNREFCVYSI